MWRYKRDHTVRFEAELTDDSKNYEVLLAPHTDNGILVQRALFEQEFEPVPPLPHFLVICDESPVPEEPPSV